MRTTFIQGFEIIYSTKEIDDAIRLREMIWKNPELFKKILPKKITLTKEQKGYFYISSLDKYLKEIVVNLYNKIINNLSELNDYSELNIYIQLLINKYNDSKYYKNLFTENNTNLLYSLLASLNYKEDTKVINFIEKIDEKEKNQLFEKLKSKERVSAINYFLDIIIKSIPEINIDTLENTNNYFSNLYNESNISIKETSKKQTYEYDLPYLSLKELDSLFETFLKGLDSNEKLLEEYKKAKSLNNIMYLKEDKKEYINKSQIRDGKLYLRYNNTLNDFLTLTTFFFKYLTSNYNNKSLRVSAFPELFYENEALNFLDELNYDKKDINNLNKIRNYNELVQYNNIKDIIPVLLMYKNRSDLTKDNFTEIIDDSLEELRNAYLELYSVNKDLNLEVEIVKGLKYLEDKSLRNNKANNLIDSITMKIIKQGKSLLINLNYLLGAYFVEKLKTYKKEDRLEIALYILNNIEDFNIEELNKLLIEKNKSYYK
jgi:hypothetical protein